MKKTTRGIGQSFAWRSGRDVLLATLGLAAAQANGQCWQAELIGEDCKQFDGLGWAVDISNDGAVAIAGAIGHDSPHFGAAFVFEVIDGEWREIEKLSCAGPSAFGTAVAIRPDGAQAFAMGWLGHGAFYSRSGDNWSLTQQIHLQSVNIGAVAEFSSRGNVLLVGSGRGRLYIYERTGDEWELVQIIPKGGHFGKSVAASHTAEVIAVAGEPGPPVSGVAIYRRFGDEWRFEKLFTDDGLMSCGDGVELSSDGSWFFYSQVRSDVERNGEVLAYRYVHGDWIKMQTIESVDSWAQSGFGDDIACSADGTTLVIGNATDSAVASFGGSVSIYALREARYELVGKQYPPNNVTMANFGYDIELTPDGETLISGAFLGGRGYGELPMGTGAAYVLNPGDCDFVPRDRGDLDGDFDVDALDLGILLNAYEKTAAGDVDGDDDTDQHDLGILLSNYGKDL